MRKTREGHKNKIYNKRYIDFGDLPSRYLVEKGKELVVEKYNKVDENLFNGKRS